MVIALTDCKIKIIKNGPYMVSGNVPLEEKKIIYVNSDIQYSNGETIPHNEIYALCRCGKSKIMPFCDGSHIIVKFDGRETASKEPYLKQAVTIKGPNLVLTDQKNLCAFARFCHKADGDVWSLTEKSSNPKYCKEAIQAACDCPAGRLVAWDSVTGKAIEPTYEPSIVIIQDPTRQCSGPIWVRGGIPIESSDGSVYEIRNRVTLCRCGESLIKPFCDASHVSAKFNDGRG